MNTIYLDNGATSWPKAPRVASVMQEFIATQAVNIGRGGYERAYETAEHIQCCRDSLATFFGAPDSRNVTFTLNVTHAINTLISGLFTPHDHVLVSSMEHNAVMRPLTQLAIPYSLIPCDLEGYVIVESIEKLITPSTKAIIITQASNVCGSIQPIQEVIKIAKRNHLKVIVDAAQLPLSSSLSIVEDGIDAIAFTGHKSLLGPQGVGGLILSNEMAANVRPWATGGTGSKSDELQMPDFLPDKFEAGTQNLPGIVGLAVAMEYIKENREAIVKREMALTQQLLDYFESDSRINIIGPKTISNRTSVISVDFPDSDNAEIAYKLFDDAAIETRVGLHCAPLAHQSLKTFPKGTLRFSLGYATTQEEIEKTISSCKKVLST